MKLLSILLISTLSLLGSFCFDKFEIIETTSQKWNGGQRNTGYGTYYEINIVPKINSEHLVFDQLWIGEKYFEIQTYQKGKKMRNNLFSKGDTITIQVNNRTVPESLPFAEKEKCLTEKHETPFEYEGEALLSYTYKDNRKYKEINNFKKKKALQYP